jgi:hypothetical protein
MNMNMTVVQAKTNRVGRTVSASFVSNHPDGKTRIRVAWTGTDMISTVKVESLTSLPSTPHKHDTDNGCCDVCGKWETDQPLAVARTSAYDNSVL